MWFPRSTRICSLFFHTLSKVWKIDKVDVKIAIFSGSTHDVSVVQLVKHSLKESHTSGTSAEPGCFNLRAVNKNVWQSESANLIQHSPLSSAPGSKSEICGKYLESRLHLAFHTTCQVYHQSHIFVTWDECESWGGQHLSTVDEVDEVCVISGYEHPQRTLTSPLGVGIIAKKQHEQPMHFIQTTMSNMKFCVEKVIDIWVQWQWHIMKMAVENAEYLHWSKGASKVLCPWTATCFYCQLRFQAFFQTILDRTLTIPSFISFFGRSNFYISPTVALANCLEKYPLGPSMSELLKLKTHPFGYVYPFQAKSCYVEVSLNRKPQVCERYWEMRTKT